MATQSRSDKLPQERTFLSSPLTRPGLQYPASSSVLSIFRGSRDVVDRLVSQSVRCPRQTFALVGYSQGAAVMHAAADDIPRALHSRIKAVVMFGDPALRLGDGSFPSGLQSKVLQNCAEGDPVSLSIPLIVPRLPPTLGRMRA